MTEGRLLEKCCECGQLIEHTDDSPIICGDLILRPGFNTAEWRGKTARFTQLEFSTLAFIVKCGDAMARKMAIYTAVFEQPDGTPEPKIVDVMVCKIRKKLAVIDAAGLIATVWGQGYRLDLTNGSLPVLTGVMRQAAKAAELAAAQPQEA
mgnify:CR=1 FL=1